MPLLSTAQLARASALLEEALDLAPDARARWLDALPDQDRDLLPALQRALLGDAGDNRVDALLAAAPPLGAALAQATTGLEAGDAVGPWRLMRRLGAGGMAEVWLAQRADGAFRREVALKVPARSPWRPDLLQRFAIERDILATLEHPHIARFYDAGVAADGRPYFVLEHVAGTGLLEWAEARQLDARERVELLLQVVQAVQYAHDQGVLHRDIKPANVLVTATGQARLLDFGVATLTERTADGGITREFGSALTPGYASPEQLAGWPADAASDVYALGVVLHELLSPPRQSVASGAPAAITPAEPMVWTESTAPAAPMEPAARSPLRGDLGAIVRRATAHAVADRYPSAAALADDLQRWLAGRPVQAVPGTLGYRVRCFVARHRAGVAVAAALAATAGAVAMFVLPALRGAVPPAADLAANDRAAARDATAPLRASGDAAAAAAPPAGTTALARAVDPRARRLVQQADVYANGPFERDAQRAEVAYHQAAAIDPDDALPWARLAELHLRQARQASTRAQRDAAHTQARQAIDTALRVDADSMPALAMRFAWLLQVERRWGEARAVLDRMRAVDPREPMLLPGCEAQFAALGGRLGEASHIQRQIVERHPDDPAALGTLARYLLHDGRVDDALVAWRRELSLNPHAGGSRAWVGVTLALRGRGDDALAEIGREPDRALRLWAAAVVQNLRGRRVEADAAIAELTRSALPPAYALAQLHTLRGQRQTALQWLQRACQEPQGGCEMLRADRFLQGLRDTPGYAALLARMRLDGEPAAAR